MNQRQYEVWEKVIRKATYRINPPYGLREDLPQQLWLTVLERGWHSTDEPWTYFHVLASAGSEWVASQRREHFIINPEEAWRGRDVLAALRNGDAQSLIGWATEHIPAQYSTALREYAAQPTATADNRQLQRAAARVADVINTRRPGDDHDGPGARQLLSNAAERVLLGKQND